MLQCCLEIPLRNLSCDLEQGTELHHAGNTSVAELVGQVRELQGESLIFPRVQSYGGRSPLQRIHPPGREVSGRRSEN